MEFAKAFAGQVPQDRDAVIELMRGFSQACMGCTVRRLSLSEEQVQAVIARGNLTGPGRYRQPSFRQIGGITPFYKQFKPTSDMFDRAMLGTEPTGGNDWLAGVRIHTEMTGEGRYRISALYAGLIRGGNSGTDIQERIVPAATAAAEEAGFHRFRELSWADVREHMWGISWTPEQTAAKRDEDLAAEVGWLLAALVPPLRDRRPVAVPRVVLFPRFDRFDTSSSRETYFTPPTTGSYQLIFRAAGKRLLPQFGPSLPVITSGGNQFSLNVTGGGEYGTSCSGDFTRIRELGQALAVRHGDHLRMESQPDGTWLLERAEPPGLLVRLGTIGGSNGQLDGAQALAGLEAYLRRHPDVWFGVRTATGMKPTRRFEYEAALQREIPVRVYLSAGSSAGGTGDVTYVARLLGIASDGADLPAPGPGVLPDPDNIRMCKLWLRLTEIEPVAIPLGEFMLEENGKAVDRTGHGPVFYVYRERPAEAAQPELELIGASREIEDYFAEVQQISQERGACMYFWTFGIRKRYREQLEQEPFWLNIHRGGGEQEITHRCRVVAIHTTDDTDGMPSPDLALTPGADRDRLERTWLKATDFEELLEPIPLSGFVDYDSGDPILPQALINAFAYVRRRAEPAEGPDSDSASDGAVDRVHSLGELLEAFAASADLVYDPADIINLHHALGTLPHKHFVILHGVSGTGKSQLAQAYANALYGYQPLTEPKNPYYQIVSVQPTWQDRTPLLGYYNPLTETYEQPPFLQHVLKATNDPAHQYVICLDEMNLAVVEHYFADFLSAWESREPIPLHHHSGKVTNVPEKLAVPPNLMLIGTVNVDETTHGFSPKVLDRAFTVELARINIGTYGERFIRRCETDGESETVRGTLDLLVKVHAILEKQGLHFAYRTASEILSFLLTNARGGDHALPEAAALDLMLCQKVLPKLRGDERMLPMLDGLITLFDQQPWGASPRCRGIVSRMKAEAERYGTFQYWR